MMKIAKMAILILVLVLPLISYAADIYKWVDKDGSVNFTDDLSKVPPEYRDQVKTEDVAQGTQGTQESKLFKQEELDLTLASQSSFSRAWVNASPLRSLFRSAQRAA